MQVIVHRFEERGSMRFQTAGGIGVITLDRPQFRNALTRRMWRTLEEWCLHLPPRVRVLVIRGRPGEFSAGSDIQEFATLTPAEADGAFEQMERAIAAVESLPVPTIASVDGPAYGAAFVLTLACDLRVGSERARFGMPVGKLGITLQPPFLRRLVQHLGPAQTKAMVYTASSYDAHEAHALGLLHQVTTSEALDAEVMRLARTILQQSSASLCAVKEGVNAVLRGVTGVTGHWVDADDFVEGVQAFREKRAARFARRFP
jgi:enoyl-CoA hydratase